MKRIHCMLLFLLVFASSTYAQLNCAFTHYSQDNGLSENTVMDMVQDKDGRIWLATWDGINQFDGYDFKVYKARKENEISWTSNRVDHLAVGKNGNIWCITYDGKAFRFNKKMEAFEEVLQSGKEADLVIQKILPLANGTVWLLTKDSGGVRIVHSQDDKLISEMYPSGQLMGEKKTTVIHSVFLDDKNKEWLLTDNGLLCIDGKTGVMEPCFVNTHELSRHSDQAFFSAAKVESSIFFGSAKGKIWQYDLKSGGFTLKELPVSDDVISIHSLKNGKVVFVTRKSGFGYADASLEEIEWFGQERGFDFARFPIQSVYVDREDEVWLAVNRIGCVCHFNPQTKTLKVEQITVEQSPADRSTPEFSICESVDGNLWVHPVGGGLSWFDRAKNCLVPFYDEVGMPGWRFSNKLHAMMSDRQGNLWLCTHSKGLEKVTLFQNEFKLFKPRNCDYDTNANQIRSLCEDSKHRFWIGTRDGKISVYSSSFELLGYLSPEGRIVKSGESCIIPAYKIREDSKGNIWMATKGEGVIQLSAEGRDRFRIKRYMYDANDIYSLSHNSVYDICEDGKGRMWCVTFGGGLNLMERQSDGTYRFINSRNNLKAYPSDRCYRARRIQRDGTGRLWVATSNGLLSFSESFNRPEDIVFRLYEQAHDMSGALSNNDVYDILLTSAGRLFFATFGGGLNELKETGGKEKMSFESFNMQDGLPTEVLMSLAEDDQGNLWIGSQGGLSKFDLKTHHFDNYLKRELGEELYFEESTALHTSDGRLLFGTNRGLVSFVPKQIRKNTYVPRIVLSKLKIMNKEISPSVGGLLPESLNSLSKLELSHRENTVTLSFATLDMTFPDNVRYAYTLEGFDKDWNYVGKQRTATYTNLPKGNYVFRVKSTNGAGIWVENEHSLNIVVEPSFWETTYAYLMYVVLFLAVLLGGTYILFIIYRLKHEVSVEQQVTDMKLRFFTNISHELRTPLTLIEGPVEYILRKKDLAPEIREQLDVVDRNTHRMLRLVNQILDFRKIQNKKMKMRVEQVDIVPFVQKIMENFESIAETNRIDFIFESEQAHLTLWVDTDKVEKIVFNLLSNAFKYTQAGKSIRVFVREDERMVSVGVQDQGIGISEKKRDSLFVRFETLLDKNLFNQNSSGIGLSLVKELVDMHHAAIRVESKEGEGSCFIVDFKKGKDHYDEATEFIVSDDIVNQPHEEDKETEDVPAQAPDSPQGVAAEQPTMLLVEDNMELRFFLRSVFAENYRIIEASNGVEGVERATAHIPDIIISDIMMPEKDGIAMTKELRDNMTTSHIPIVLLTAKTDMDSKLQGMELGVDSYITKPFSAVYLEARVNNLLERRRNLRKFYYEHLMEVNPAEHAVAEEKEQTDTMSAQDRKFLDKLTALMEEHMDNGELMVDDLVGEMAVSRSVFFKKLKSLTGLAPIEFIKEMRVKRAAQLIETGEYNMTQISYMVGINDPRYFSKCFKQRFGMTPTEYKEKMRK